MAIRCFAYHLLMETTEPEVPPLPFESGKVAHLALVVLAYPTDPARVGEVAFVPQGAATVLGRESAKHPEIDLAFARLRPGVYQPGPPLAARTLSRRHVVFRADETSITVENFGKASIYVDGVEHNGVIALAPGQTLAVGRTLLLACTKRGERLAPMRTLRMPSKPGEADSAGFAGESELAWKLRECIEVAARTDEHVLLVGVDGSGRGLAAKMVHARSPRGEREPVVVNAAALDPQRAAARIVGDGANTSALAAAEGSTLILERAHRLPSHVQSALADHLEASPIAPRLVMTVDKSADLAASPLFRRVATRITVPTLAERMDDAWCWLLATGVDTGGFDVESMEGFVADLRERGFSALAPLTRSEEATNEAAIPQLPPTLEFELHLEAVREALRSFHDAMRLDRSRLLGMKAVKVREPSADKKLAVAALRAVLTTTIERLDLVRDRDLLRETYLTADAKQLAIAERFHMPYSTYRRHLARAAERLAERLWQEERGR